MNDLILILPKTLISKLLFIVVYVNYSPTVWILMVTLLALSTPEENTKQDPTSP